MTVKFVAFPLRGWSFKKRIIGNQERKEESQNEQDKKTGTMDPELNFQLANDMKLLI